MVKIIIWGILILMALLLYLDAYLFENKPDSNNVSDTVLVHKRVRDAQNKNEY